MFRTKDVLWVGVGKHDQAKQSNGSLPPLGLFASNSSQMDVMGMGHRLNTYS